MKNVLIINGHQRYDEVAKGNLTKMYINSASEFFEKNGFNVKHSVVESDYDVKEEVEKFVWAIFYFNILFTGWVCLGSQKNI